MTATLVDDLLAFASIPAPTFEEEARIAWLEQRLAQEPGQLTRDAVGNLLWLLGEGPVELLLLAHVDTVFPPHLQLRFERREGRLVGPGVGDNAAAVVAVVHALSRRLRRGAALPGAAAFTVGEEGLGNLRGAHEACERLRPTRALAVEGHGLEHVLVDAVGSVRIRVRVTGPGGHSWENRGTPSAIHALLALVHELARLDDPESPVNVGLVSGGQSVNSIAAEAELVVEQRSLDEGVLTRFAAAAEGLSLESPLALTIEEVGRRPAARLDRTDRLLETVRRVRETLGLPDVLKAGSTDANAALGRGIPALTLGVAHGGGMHTATEWLDEATLSHGLRQLEAVLEALSLSA